MTENNQQPDNTGQPADNQGASGSGEPQKALPIDDSRIKELIKGEIGQVYSKFQQGVSTFQQKYEDEKRARIKAEQDLEEVENLPKLKKEAEEARNFIIQVEVQKVRNQIVAQEFPNLKGKEQYIQGITAEEMRESAKNLMKDFGLSGDNKPTSLNSGIGPQAKSRIDLSGFYNMSEAEQKEILKKLSNDDLARLTGNPPIPAKK